MTARRSALHIALEGTPGTAEVSPDAAEFVDAFSASMVVQPRGNIPREPIRPWIDPAKAAAAHSHWWALAFQAELKAAVAAGDAPELGAWFQACGLSEVLVGSTSATYETANQPAATANLASITAWLEDTETDGNRKEAHGVRGTLAMEFSNQGRVLVNCAGVGGYNAVVPCTSAYYDSSTLNAGIPISHLADASPIAIGAWADAVLRSGSIALGLEGHARPSMGAGAANGYCKLPAGLRRAGDLAVVLTIEAPVQGDFDGYAKMLAATAEDVVMNFAAGSRALEITLREVTWSNIAEQHEDPLIMVLTGSAAHDGSDSALSMVFT